jgi:hypothetical protein
MLEKRGELFSADLHPICEVKRGLLSPVKMCLRSKLPCLCRVEISRLFTRFFCPKCLKDLPNIRVLDFYSRNSRSKAPALEGLRGEACISTDNNKKFCVSAEPMGASALKHSLPSAAATSFVLLGFERSLSLWLLSNRFYSCFSASSRVTRLCQILRSFLWLFFKTI